MNNKIRFIVITLMAIAFSPILIPFIWLADATEIWYDYVEFYRKTWGKHE